MTSRLSKCKFQVFSYGLEQCDFSNNIKWYLQVDVSLVSSFFRSPSARCKWTTAYFRQLQVKFYRCKTVFHVVWDTLMNVWFSPLLFPRHVVFIKQKNLCTFSIFGNEKLCLHISWKINWQADIKGQVAVELFQRHVILKEINLMYFCADFWKFHYHKRYHKPVRISREFETGYAREIVLFMRYLTKNYHLIRGSMRLTQKGTEEGCVTTRWRAHLKATVRLSRKTSEPEVLRRFRPRVGQKGKKRKHASQNTSIWLFIFLFLADAFNIFG